MTDDTALALAFDRAAGLAAEGGGAPASLDPRLVGTFEASRWFYDYPDGERIAREDFDATTWILRLRADGTYDLHREWWVEGDLTNKNEDGTWSVAPPREADADGVLQMQNHVGIPCTETFEFAVPDDPDVALTYWRRDGPTCDGTREYSFYRVEWARIE